MKKQLYMALGVAVLTASVGCNGPSASDIDETPLYRWKQNGAPSSGERGSLQITEIDYAGSVKDDGTRDADDVFIEMQNKHPRPINISGWRLIVEGDSQQSYRIPDTTKPIKPNDYFVIARKRDGAFKNVADVFIDNLELGPNKVFIELRDYDHRLMEAVGSPDEEAFAGGWDTVTVRSMERAQLIFGNDGDSSRNWHAYSDTVGFNTIAEGYRKKTLASPGEANSADYSGNTTSGNFQ